MSSICVRKEKFSEHLEFKGIVNEYCNISLCFKSDAIIITIIGIFIFKRI